MLADYVVRGLQAGLVAGLAFGLFVALVANPLVAAADGLAHGAHGDGGHDADGAHDSAHAAGHESGGHESAVSTAVTKSVSVLSSVLWGLLLGGVGFGLAFYFLEPAIPGRGAARQAVLAGAGFLTVSGAPWLALPPQVPGAEQTLPTDTRMLVYAGMVVAGAVACLLAGAAYNRIRPTRGRAVATAAAGCVLALLAVPAALAPANPATHALPGALASATTRLVVFGQALCWTVLAAVHARLHRAATDGGSAADDAGGAADYAVSAD